MNKSDLMIRARHVPNYAPFPKNSFDAGVVASASALARQFLNVGQGTFRHGARLLRASSLTARPRAISFFITKFSDGWEQAEIHFMG